VESFSETAATLRLAALAAIAKFGFQAGGILSSKLEMVRAFEQI